MLFYKTDDCLSLTKMKQLVTDILVQFQKGQISLQEATDRLLTTKRHDQTRKAKSNQRLRNLCSALQRARNPVKIREIKNKLSHEFYFGDIKTLLSKQQSPVGEEV